MMRVPAGNVLICLVSRCFHQHAIDGKLHLDAADLGDRKYL